MKTKTIKLCEGHKGGFGLMRIISPDLTYKGTPVNKLTVTIVEKSDCVQCKSNQSSRKPESK